MEVTAQLEIMRRARQNAVTIPLRVCSGYASQPAFQPVTVGVPCARGTVLPPLRGWLSNLASDGVPAQVEPLVHWPDGSVKWLLADFLLPASWNCSDGLKLELASGEADVDRPGLSFLEKSDHWLVSTGCIRFTKPNSTLRPFSNIEIPHDGAVDCGSRIVMTDRRGREHEPALERWYVEQYGTVRLTLVGEGKLPGVRGLRVRLRESYYIGTGMVKLEVTLHNPRRAKHRRGVWDLGDAGSTLFDDMSLLVTLPQGRSSACAWSLGAAEPPSFGTTSDFTLYQDSSGGPNWRHVNHINRNGENLCRFRGYQLSVADQETSGHRASPTLCVTNGRTSVTAAVPDFWHQFPKSITFDERGLRCGLFPGEFADKFELQGGEQKTHTIWLRFDGGTNQDAISHCRSMDWVHDPIRVWADPEWCDGTGALPALATSAGKTCERLDSLLDEAHRGDQSLFVQRDTADEYGWRNYGDVFADHEQRYYRGAQPLVSHYNNQFDILHGMLLEGLRLGEPDWMKWADALARHVVDIDIYHTVEDKAAYNGGLFWFTDHYLHAHTSTHRTYSRANRRSWRASYGGGPSAEHNFTSGLLLHYCLTGSRDSRDAVIGLADWVIAMDDGRRNIYGVVESGPTGRATGGAAPQLGRATGNSINALLDGWQLTRRQEYLDYAELLIRRTIHPDDDVAARRLLDVEKNWSYTVFLSSLSKFIDAKADAEQFDRMHAYAQSCLVRCARWMLDHEKPYFDQADTLEFPTEAWAAQEFRKANVLRLAARHEAEPLRTRLFDRGEELAERAWSDLLRFSTRTAARAMAIVMTEGLLDCVLRSRPMVELRRLPAVTTFGEREPFLSQREKLRRELASLRGAARIVARLANPVRWLQHWQTSRSATSQLDGAAR
jgi:hypothetical protein